MITPKLFMHRTSILFGVVCVAWDHVSHQNRGAHNQSIRGILCKILRSIGWCKKKIPYARKTKIRRIVSFLLILCLKLELLEISKPEGGPNTLPMSRVCDSRSFELLVRPHLSTQNHGTCHFTIDSGLTEIQPQLDRNEVPAFWSKFNPNFIEISCTLQIAYRAPIGNRRPCYIYIYI